MSRWLRQCSPARSPRSAFSPRAESVAARGARPLARSTAYRYLIAYQWLLVGAIAAVWFTSGRPWSVLLLGPVNPWRLVGGLALVAAYVAFLAQQRRAILSRPRLLEIVRRGLGGSEAVMPHTTAERRLWTFAAMTAGICEEVLFRGFLLAFVAAYTGLAAAVLIGAVLFGLYHANQGRAAIVKTGAVGLVVTLIALASGSLIPVILWHVAQDLLSGDIGYHAVTASVSAATPASEPRAG